MKTRIPLLFTHGQLVLYAVVATATRQRLVAFVIDTGSANTFLSAHALSDLGITPNARRTKEHVHCAGTTFEKIPVPHLTIHAWAGCDRDDPDQYMTRTITAYGLRPTRRKHCAQHTLPSILGMHFLRDQQLSLHVDPAEEIAYLETQ